ncbi:MAG: cation diffusion facilitator family transporter [Promethearchaeota archaeon]
MKGLDKKTRFAFYSLIIILFQTCLKLLGVMITGSLSLLSESVDTLVDIVFVSITLYSVKHSQKPPDYEHMYGHTKTDSIGAMIQGIILINLYILLIIYAIMSILTNSYQVANANIGLVILIISFSTNLIFSRFLIWQGRRYKSPSLEIQGLNLFQDSLRAIVVIVSFTFALYGIIFLDPFFSIVLSTWIIISSFKLAKKGADDLTDINPVDSRLLEEIRIKIFNLDHVNGVDDLKIRASGRQLFFEAHLSVEDHISVIHAHEITKAIRDLGDKLFPVYEVECIVEMNPLGGEKSFSEKIINLIFSMKSEYPKILNIRNINVFRIEDKYFLVITMNINENLTLRQAHDICTEFENELKQQVPQLNRIITHLESQYKEDIISPPDIECVTIDDETMNEMKRLIEDVLKSHSYVKGFHGFEFWATFNACILELHVFFEGDLNIMQVHEYITDLENDIRDKLKIDNLQEIILHSEPVEGRKDGILFNDAK